jgi:hypothetical protein
VNETDPSGLCGAVACLSTAGRDALNRAEEVGTVTVIGGLIVCLAGVDVVCDIGAGVVGTVGIIGGALVGLGEGIVSDVASFF